jgi:putative spermidine/putrescine transport system substrate-binding protein/spermidine/putrescine transport system substrate-binding protein
LPTYSQLSAKLRDLPLAKANGQVYGVPFMWGPNPLLYDTTAFSQPPDSWTIFWNPKYKGKISVWDDLSTVYMAAQILGFDKPDPSQLYNLTDEQLAAIRKKLIELKPNVRKLWSSGGELTNLFQNHEVVLAMGWPLNTNDLRKLDFPIAETIPRGNTTGWIDRLMIARKRRQGTGPCISRIHDPGENKSSSPIAHTTLSNPGASQFLTPEEMKGLHLDNRTHTCSASPGGTFLAARSTTKSGTGQSRAVNSAAANSQAAR